MKQFMLASGLALGLGMVAQGANYYVDGAAAKGGDGSAKAPFATIQQAADLAQAGDTVFIKPGTYTETVKPKNSGKEQLATAFRLGRLFPLTGLNYVVFDQKKYVYVVPEDKPESDILLIDRIEGLNDNERAVDHAG